MLKHLLITAACCIGVLVLLWLSIWVPGWLFKRRKYPQRYGGTYKVKQPRV